MPFRFHADITKIKLELHQRNVIAQFRFQIDIT